MRAPGPGPATWALAIGLGTLGGFLARALGLPLPFLIGALVTTAASAIAGWRPFGDVIGLPMYWRSVAVPVIGVSIGSAVTPDLLRDLGRWLPSLLALLIYVPLAHALAFTIARRTTPIDRATAFYGTMPGGFIEAIMLGEKAGADAALLSVMQFLRLILCIAFIPLGFTLVTGHAVGSAAGEVIGNGPLSPLDWVLLALAGLIGGLGARRLGVPAALITGPIFLSGLLHLFGIVEGGPPRWLIDATQLVIGITLGMRFADRAPGVLLQGARAAGLTVGATLVLAALAAALLAPMVGERWEAVFLAFAPGGIAEMSLVALSLEISVIYVTAHHILRIVLAVIFARLGAARGLAG